MIFLLVLALVVSLDFTDVGWALPDNVIVTDNRGFPSFQLQDHVKPDPWVICSLYTNHHLSPALSSLSHCVWKKDGQVKTYSTSCEVLCHVLAVVRSAFLRITLYCSL